MEKNITRADRSISYSIRSYRRSRSVRISVHHDGRVVVTKPASVSVARAEGFVFSRFDWIAATIDKFKLKPQKLLSHFSAADYAARKAEALAMVRERVKHLNEIYGFEIGKIAVRNQRTRWGSCSGKKNLNFNYKLLYLPPELCDYIVVHELCHLKEMNHSARFWAQVARAVPDHKERRRAIRAY